VSEPVPSEDALARIELLLQENQKLLKQNAELLFKISRQLENQLPGATESVQPEGSDEDREFFMGL